MKKTTKQQHFYKKYEHLAYRYANHIYDIHYLGFEKEDLVQELKIKIYTSIGKFGEKWSLYLKTGLCKPVPLVKYLESCMNMKLRDYIKQIQKTRNSSFAFRSCLDEVDIGREADYTEIDFLKNNIVIKGVDILHGLNKEEKQVFSLHLKGYTKAEISKFCANKKVDVVSTIDNQTLKLFQFKNHFLNQDREFIVENHYYSES